MKRPLMIAALLVATPLLANKGNAEPLQMFNVNAPAAGVMTFGGTGTASYSQSLGSNNAINVGSSTNLGVNASASSSQDYTSSGSAHLALDSSSEMMQSTGTATSAFNAATITESASRSADTTATSIANRSTYGREYNTEWSNQYAKDSGWEFKEAGAMHSHGGSHSADGMNSDSGAYEYDDGMGGPQFFQTGDTYYSSELDAMVAAPYDLYLFSDGTTVMAEDYENSLSDGYGDTGDGSNESQDSAAGYYKVGASYGEEGSYQTAEQWESSSKNAYNTGKNKVYQQAYEQAFETNLSAATATTSEVSDQGVITANFSNSETGNAVAALDALSASFVAGAEAAADAKYGDTFVEDEWESRAEYDAAWASEYQSSYASAYSNANSSLQRENESTVEVSGLGSIAYINADTGSQFDAQTQMTSDVYRDANGTGSAGAGTSLTTSSYANQSNSTNTSAFIQAFGGGAGAPGSLAITGVSGNSSDGYTIDGTRTITNNVQIAVNGGIVGNEVVVNNASGSTSNGAATDNNTMTGGGETETVADANGGNYDPATGDGTNGDEYYDPAMDDGQNGVVAY